MEALTDFLLKLQQKPFIIFQVNIRKNPQVIPRLSIFVCNHFLIWIPHIIFSNFFPQKIISTSTRTIVLSMAHTKKTFSSFSHIIALKVEKQPRFGIVLTVVRSEKEWREKRHTNIKLTGNVLSFLYCFGILKRAKHRILHLPAPSSALFKLIIKIENFLLLVLFILIIKT